MKILLFLLIVSLVSVITKDASAENILDSKKSDFGFSIVDENIANPGMPTHTIALLPQQGSSLSGNLVFRCTEEKFEIFYLADSANFFSRSAADLKVRFNSEAKSSKISTNLSSNMKGVFINSSIPFINKLIKEGAVVISGEYYSNKFAGLFKFDEMMLTEIYRLSDRCHILNKIPIQKEAKILGIVTMENDQVSDLANKERLSGEKTLTSELSELISKYGLKKVKDKIVEIENTP